MSKSLGGVAVGGLFGSTKAKVDSSPTNNLISYLNNYDTSNSDAVLSNLAKNAYNQSQKLGDMGDYNFSVEASDEARKRAEDAQFNSYMNYMQPQFDRQTSDLATSLQNKGLAVGSEAYQRAMNDLQDNQNRAINQASYDATTAGQNAYSQSLADSINAGNFGNTAQLSYINQLLAQLEGTQSSYDVAMDKYAAQNNLASQRYAAEQQAINNRIAIMNSLIQAGAGAAAASDERLKENIVPVGKLNNGLTVYCYNFIGDNVPQIGLIAQEVVKVKPEAVVEREDGYLAVNYKLATEE